VYRLVAWQIEHFLLYQRSHLNAVIVVLAENKLLVPFPGADGILFTVL
jgi:hypothetical protein